MKILLTGAFGNIGAHTLEELLQRGHRVRCFDVRTKRNEKIARKYQDQIEVIWGDLRTPQDIAPRCGVQVFCTWASSPSSVTGSEQREPDFALR
jgi:nucleoside-diphosphate-sugar epimerase